MLKVKFYFLFALSFVLWGLICQSPAKAATGFYCGDPGAKWNHDYSVWPTVGKYDLNQFPLLSDFVCVPGSRTGRGPGSSSNITTCESGGNVPEPTLGCEGDVHCEKACPPGVDGKVNGILCCKSGERCVRSPDCGVIGGRCCNDATGWCDDNEYRRFLKQKDIDCATGTITNGSEVWQIIRFRCKSLNGGTCWRKIVQPPKTPEEKIPSEITPSLEETPRDPKKTPNISVGDCCRQIVPPLDDPYNDDYTLNDVVQTAVNVYECILCIVGALILMALVAGAIILMISGGNDKRVAMGKQIITGAVIGGVIVFFSFLIVNFVVKAVGARFIDEGKVQVNPQGYLPAATTSDKKI